LVRGQSLQQLDQQVRNGLPSPPPGPSAPAAPTTPTAPSGPKPNPNSSGDNGGAAGDGSDDETALLVGGAVVGTAIATAPYWVPVSMLGDDPFTPSYALRYPYWQAQPGSMYPTDATAPRQRKIWGEFSMEYANDFDDLSRLGAHLRISTASRFEFETNWNVFTQDSAAGRDHLTLGDTEVVYRFAESETLQFRSGLGANWLEDHQGLDGGFNFRYGVEWYPAQPWAIKSSADVGELGKAFLVHARTTVGASYQRWELYTGYDFLRVGTVQISGPVAGVLMRF
jgi:hypothetical protein